MLLVYLDKILGINSYGIIPIDKIEGFTLNILKNPRVFIILGFTFFIHFL